MTRMPLCFAAVALAATATATHAKDSPPDLAKCDQSLGTVALVDGDQAGWTQWGLGSPRELINALALESSWWLNRVGLVLVIAVLWFVVMRCLRYALALSPNPQGASGEMTR